jgi:hypothetical protein
MKKMFPIPNSSTLDHSQVRAANSRHHSRSSRRNRCGRASERIGIRIRPSRKAHTTKEALSNASATPGLAATTRIPPIAGPTTRTALRDNPWSALACCSRAGLIVCGINATSAGITNPSPAPYSTARATNAMSEACPDRTTAAVVACAAPCTSEAPTSTRLRGRRSESTPPNNTTAPFAPCRAANTMPRSVALPTSSTAKARAMFAIASPSDVTSVAENSRRYSRSTSAPRRPERSPPTSR